PYTKLPSEIDSNSYGNLIGIKYTKASISLKTNVPMSSAIMRFSDGTNLTLQPIGNKEYVTQLNITENKTWYLELIDILKRKNTPEEKTITVIPDNPPEIKIIEPGEDIVLNKNMTLPIRIIASDDFGLKNLILFQQKNEENSVSSDLQSVINNTNLDFDYIQSFLNFNLLPGDVVTYWAEIYDNSPDNQKAVSQKFKARFPSIEEIYREIEKQEQRKKDELAELLNKSKDLQKDFEQKRRELLKEEKLNWEDKKQLEDIVKKQQEFIKQIENLADNYQSLIDKLEQNEALSSETLQKMQKIQEIMQEINNEQLQQALKQFEKALQDLNPDAVKKAIENFKFSLEDFNKKIDNTLKLLESIRKEQAVQKALQISQEMEKMQQTLNEKTMDTKFSSEKLVEEQKQISEKLSSLNQQLDEIQKLLDQGKDKEAQNLLNEIKELAKDKDLDESLLDSQMKLSQNLRFQAQNSQKQALTKMKQMSRRLTDMKNLLGSSSQAEIMIAIQTAIRELLIFSQKHEEAASKFKQDPYLILSDLMATYEGIQLSINKLFSNPMVMMFTPPKFFSDTNQTYQGYRDFFLNVNEIQYYNLNNNLEAIQTGLNLMVYDLLLALNQSQSNGSAGSGMQSFMKMLQQMGEEQLAMNLLTQQLLQQMQQNGGRLGQAIQNQLQRLSEEQERLAENLKRTLQNNPEAQKQGNSLKQMVEEMDAVSRQLKQNKLDQNLINRQERILSKLLDAQKSINKREFSQKRKGETAEDKNYNSPSSQIDYNLLKKKALLDEQYRQFPKEYQKVIQQYLKNLVEVNH
ncbi:MAG: hypothetical protein N3A61_05690, partial [Ignavibacteria bacterium]|nr:hypothetical protein [Ignavibacteria bacterium]